MSDQQRREPLAVGEAVLVDRVRASTSEMIDRDNPTEGVIVGRCEWDGEPRVRVRITQVTGGTWPYGIDVPLPPVLVSVVRLAQRRLSQSHPPIYGRASECDLSRLPVVPFDSGGPGEDIDTDEPVSSHGKRYINPGVVATVVLPHSEVCTSLRMAGQAWPVRITESRMVQILHPTDGSAVSFPITRGEAGVREDAGGLWVESLPTDGRHVTRDGAPASPVFTGQDAEDQASRWLMRHQSMSVQWATTHEGYSIERVSEYVV